MATATLPSVPSRADARVRADLAQAALRIRVKDAAAGGLGLVALLLLYVAVTVSLDRAFELSAAARFAGLATFAVAVGLIAYFGVVRPLRRRVNPRYAARQVERATPGGAKNAVINYVDLENEDLAASVRASLAGRAADEVAASDARKVSESRLVTTLLVSCGVLAAVLAGLFLWLKPAPFWSLLTRAFHPNTVATIATRSEIILDAPAGGDATVLAGDSLAVAVTIQGRVPSVSEPDRPRLLVKYNPEAEPDEVPLLPAGSSREFAALLSPGAVQNGFWYAVAAGDARTPEFRVAVRPRPSVLDYQVEYTYPAYTRLKPETARDPKVIAPRGTEVALTVTANRAVTAGALKLTTQSADVPGAVVPGSPDKLRFKFPVTESGYYTVGFTTADGEAGDRTPDQRVLATPDAKPVVTVAAPAVEEVALPLAAKLAVDGLASDDYGVTAVALKLQVAGPVPVPLKSVKYRPAKPLKRETDGSFPVSVEVKVSAELAKLTLAGSGEPANLAEGTVVEYWLEAVDNCEPAANVGKSKVQRVKIAPAAKTPDEAKQQQQAGEQRAGEEQKHEQKQDEQFKGENREPNQPRQGQPKPPEANPPQPKDAPKNGQPQQGNDPAGANPQDGAQKTNGGAQPPKADNPPPDGPKPPDAKANPRPPETGAQPPMNPPAGNPGQTQTGTGGTEKPPTDGAQKPQTGSQGANTSQQTPPATPPEDPKLEADKKRVQQALNDAGGQQPQGNPGQSDPAAGGQQPSAADRKAIEDAARDLGDPDKDKRERAEKTLDDKVGKDNRERIQREAEQLAKDLKDPAKQAEAKEKLEKLAKQAGADAKPQGGNSSGAPRPDPAAAAKAARDLADPDDAKREQAERTLDKQVGPENRKNLQQQAKDAAADRAAGQPADADKKLDAAAKQAGEMAKQAGQRNQAGAGQQPQKLNPKELQQAAEDLASGDEKTRKAAEDKLDNAIGKSNRVAAQEKAKRLKADLESGDQKRVDKAKQEINDAVKAAEQQANANKPPENGTDPPQGGQPGDGTPPDPKAVEKATRDLASPDQKTRADAAKTVKDAVGDENGKDLQKQADDIRKEKDAGGAGADAKAEQQLKELADKANAQAAAKAGKAPQAGAKGDKPQPAGGGQPDPKAIEDAVNKLQSGTDAEKAAARKTLDDAVGPKNREQAERDAEAIKNGLKSENKSEQDAAKQKLADAVKRAQEQAKNQANKPGAGQPDPKALADAVGKLNSDDPAEKAAAEKTVDDAVGKENRQAAQAEAKKLADDLKKPAGDPARKAAEQKLKDVQGQAQKQADAQAKAGEPQPKPEPSAADVEKWKKAAEDLTGDDQGKKEAAEKAFDNAITKPARQELQKDLQDLKNGTEQQKQAARQRLQQKADQAAKNDARQRGPGRGPEQKGDRLVENAKNRLKSAELQLADFEKVKADPALRDRAGFTPAEYERFLESVRESVAKQRTEVARLEAEAGKTPGPATADVSRSDKVVGTTGNTTTGSGPGTAPPGFADPQRRFAEKAAKLKKAGPR